MSSRHALEPLVPEPGSFDARSMARGVPGVPRRFTWRGRTWQVARVERTWKELNPAPAAAGDRYVRRHGFAVLTVCGVHMRIVAERGTGRSGARWWVRDVEDPTEAQEPENAGERGDAEQAQDAGEDTESTTGQAVPTFPE